MPDTEAHTSVAAPFVSLAGCAGMNKMVVNHLDKLFVTSDASTIINEMEVQHPAAKLVVFASQAQEQEIGDGSNFVSRWFFDGFRQSLRHRMMPASCQQPRRSKSQQRRCWAQSV